MKIKGRKIQGVNRELVVIPRGGDAPDIGLWAQAVVDMDDFDKLCPPPLPPSKIVKGGATEFNLEADSYKKAVMQHGKKRDAYMIIKSLDVPENELVWDTVKLADHTTYLLYDQELRDAGFSATEIIRIRNACYSANSLNEQRVTEARNAFLRGLEAEKKLVEGSDQPEPKHT